VSSDRSFVIDPEAFPRVVFFTGAGMSQESGVPTYRGHGGIWHAYAYEDYACEAAFRRDPVRVWDFHDLRRQTVAACVPHAGHEAIAAYAARHPSTRIVTQNIDGLHQRAGCRDVIELHGSLWGVRCRTCGVRSIDLSAPIANRRHTCRQYLRPDIVWFGDALPVDVFAAAREAMERASLVVAIGTSAVVYPAATLPEIARAHGATLVEVNPEDTPLSALYDVICREPAGRALARLLP
jgi:NAD-dependent deacetylase